VRDSITKKKAREQSDVDCNAQQIDYCKTYHKIVKGNGAEAKYDLSTESHLHGWRPKLAARYFNMNLNNTAKLYGFGYKKVHPRLIPMPLKEGIHNLTPLFFKEEIQCDREVQELHQVLQRILLPLLVWMVGQSARIQVNDHSNLLLQPMGLEQFIPVLLVH
jgi:hypothetical protein